MGSVASAVEFCGPRRIEVPLQSLYCRLLSKKTNNPPYSKDVQFKSEGFMGQESALDSTIFYITPQSRIVHSPQNTCRTPNRHDPQRSDTNAPTKRLPPHGSRPNCLGRSPHTARGAGWSCPSSLQLQVSRRTPPNAASRCETPSRAPRVVTARGYSRTAPGPVPAPESPGRGRTTRKTIRISEVENSRFVDPCSLFLRPSKPLPRPWKTPQRSVESTPCISCLSHRATSCLAP